MLHGGRSHEQAVENLQALQTGRIAAAVVDVLESEPPRDGNPLLDATLPNLLRLSPWLVIVPLVLLGGWWLVRQRPGAYLDGWDWKWAGLGMGVIGLLAWIGFDESGALAILAAIVVGAIFAIGFLVSRMPAVLAIVGTAIVGAGAVLLAAVALSGGEGEWQGRPAVRWPTYSLRENS